MATKEIREKGWTQFDAPADMSLVEIATELGYAVPPRPDRPLLRELKPLNHLDAIAGSLSSLHGRGSFPFHTDCAYYRSPPTHVLFRAVRPTNVATLLLDGDVVVQDQSIKARQAIFKVRGLRKFFHCRLLCDRGLRWDIDCMTPAEKLAEEVQQGLLDQCQQLTPYRFEWQSNNSVLLIDNTRILHGRENAERDNHRHLESVLIYSSKLEAKHVGIRRAF